MASAGLQALPRIGDYVDRYQVCGEIDSGGMSVIYAVKRAGAGGFSKLLAMKVILPNLAREERFTHMFLDEARILSLIQHPNVVQVLDVGETSSGLLYMVMELLRGRPMSRLIKEAFKVDGFMPRHIILQTLADGAEGLHAAHETRLPEGGPASIVHRDVSPQNIHIGFDGTVKVVDFGIAAAAGRMTETRTGELKGKLSYIAPEQIMRRSIDRRADVWSLGVISWELLAGRRLFSGDNEVETLKNVDSMDIPPLASVVKGVPARVADVVMRCLERDPAARPETAQIVAATFRDGSLASRLPVRSGGSAVASRPGPVEDVPAYVQRLLKTEMVIEKERLAAAVRAGPPPPVRPVGPEDEASDPFDLVAADASRVLEDGPPRAPRRWLAPVAIAGAVAAAFGAWALTGPASPPPVRPHEERPAVERAAPRRSTDPVPPPEPAAGPLLEAAPPVQRVVQLVLDTRIRKVWVDGRIVEGRPVRLTLAGDQVLTVEASGAAGERSRRSVGPDAPERVLISLPREPGAPATKTKKASPLLDSPYGPPR
ncbi:MAG: protein kinase [Deltaproteobacteria bacterium]|nr:protein kinase [Deltaproteobacteria bacterium]